MPTGGLISVSYNEYFPLPGVALSGLDFPTGPRGLVDGELPPESGAFDAELPLSLLPYSTVAGGTVTSYFDDYYNRIFIEPPNIDFGTITEDKTVSVRIWNAYYRQGVNLTSAIYSLSAGLTVNTGPLPRAFNALQERTVLVTARLEGSALLDEDVVFTFDLPWSFNLRVDVIRAQMWPFNPAWPPSGSSYQVGYAYLTEILVSRSGKEQRIALRDTPRRTVSNRCLLTGDQMRQYKDLMWFWQHRSFIAPEMSRFVMAAGAMSVGFNSIAVDEVPVWVLPETLVVLDYLGVRETRNVEYAADGVVVFTSDSLVEWPAGTMIYAAMAGNVAAELSAPRLTNAVAQLDMRFDVAPLSDLWADVPEPPLTFNGRELFLKRPNWVSPVEARASHEIELLDYDRGPTSRSAPVKFGVESRRALYLNRNEAEATALLDFFRRMKGRQGEFYMPTWEYDFVPKTVAPGGSAAMRVAGTRLATAYGDSTVQKAVFVLFNSGQVIVRKVLGVLPVIDGDGSDSVITVSEVWGQTVSQDTIVMSGWLPAWRMSSDSLTFEWLTNSVAQVQMTMQTLEDLPVETP